MSSSNDQVRPGTQDVHTPQGTVRVSLDQQGIVTRGPHAGKHVTEIDPRRPTYPDAPKS